MQMVPDYHLTNSFWEKETKLPLLRKEGVSRYHTGTNNNYNLDFPRNQEKQKSMRDWEHYNYQERTWKNQNPYSVHKKNSSPTLEESSYIPSRRASEMEKVFPLKPVLHRRVYSLSNYQVSSNVTDSEYKERLHSCLPRLSDCKQAANGQQQKYGRKSEPLTATHRQLTGRKHLTNSDLDTEHEVFHEKQKQIWLSKEIHSKEMILQQKIFKAEETVRRIQRERTAREDGVMKEERNKINLEKEKHDNRLYSNGYGYWEERARERDRYGGRDKMGIVERNEERKIRDDMERWEEWERERNGGQEGRRKERIRSEVRRQPLSTEIRMGHSAEEKREWSRYDHKEKDWSQETVTEERSNGRRERPMGWDSRYRREWGNEEVVNDVPKERHERTRAMHDIYPDQWNMRKLGSADSGRMERSYFKQDRITNVPKTERREHKEGLHQPTSRLIKEVTTNRRNAPPEPVLERDYSPFHYNQRENRLQQVELSLEEGSDDPHQLIPCNVCHRRFLRDRLETHIEICEKKRPQRNVFDMAKCRAKGTDLEEFMKTNKRSKTPELKKNNWRQKHETFIQNMRQGRSDQPKSVSNLNPDYVTCPYCGRKFAPGPAERHIPKCQNIKSKPPPPKQLHTTMRQKFT